MKITIDLPHIEGFEEVAEYRCPKEGETFLSDDQTQTAVFDYENHKFFVLKPIEKWIVPTLEYIQENYKWGETIEARFKDRVDGKLFYGDLKGIDIESDYKFRSSNGKWKYCEIKEVKK